MLFLLAEVLIFLVGPAVLALVLWATVRLLRPIPTRPFLALTPAKTALGRSLTVAPLLAGALGMTVLASLSFGAWVLRPSILLITFVGVGCSRSYITAWWPSSLAASLLLLGYGFVWFQDRWPGWASGLTAGSESAKALVYGAGAIFAASLWASAVALMATRDA
jgi:hypothetical protein